PPGLTNFLGDAYPALTRWAKSCSAPPGLDLSVVPALCDLGRSRSLAGPVTSRSLAGLGRSRSGCPYGCSSLRGWFWVVPPSGAGSRLFPTWRTSEDLVLDCPYGCSAPAGLASVVAALCDLGRSRS